MASSVVNASLNFNSIQALIGTNYKKWKYDIEIVLGFMDLDVALREEKPDVPEKDDSTNIKNKYEKWHNANRMAILIMKRPMSDNVRAKFKESDKAETGNLMNSLMTTKFVDGSVGEHILGLIDITAKLNALGVAISDPFLVHVALNSLPYSQLKSTYNA
ncbi:uncharacterized protein [Malus domestica]|uniref:uncharacterized protein n=1 Tax=Malus domestica TaxID=3750 RepID=UPI0039763706